VVRLALSALLAGTLFAAPAHSQGAPSTKFYASADIGSAENGVSNYAYGTPAGPRDEESNLFRVRFGYQFVRFFALEAGYADFGSYSANVEMDCSASPQVECIADFESDLDLSAWTFNAVGQLPVGDRFTLRANLGMMLRTKKTHLTTIEGDDFQRSSRKVLPIYGVGAGFAVTKKIDVFAEWSKFAGEDPSFPNGLVVAPGAMIDEADAEALSLGVRFRF
jgi:hypothetical protein